MTKKTIKEFGVDYLQVLDEYGKVDKKVEPKLSNKKLLELYTHLVRTRTFDRTALSLQREGRIGTYAECLGEEAVMCGAAFAMKKQDWLFPSYRDCGAYFVREYPMHLLLTIWGGSEDGNKTPEGQNNFTHAIPVGTHLLHAVGFAWGSKLQKKKLATLTIFGDGATSTGDFHEAMNFAGVYKTPTVFVCRNNEWAISVPRACTDTAGCQTRASTIAQKAIAYGFKGLQVDGNDVLAVYKACKEALEHAYHEGPAFVECLTYRLGAHTTADDPTRYRSEKELKEWKQRDPIIRFERYLKSKKVLDDKKIKKIQESAKKEVSAAVKKYEQHKPKVDDMFKYVYAEMPEELKEQLEYLKRFV